MTWKNKGKIIPKINNQKTLDNIIDKIKNEKNNSKYINMIFDYIRESNTKFCIKQNYEKMDIPFITFKEHYIKLNLLNLDLCIKLIVISKPFYYNQLSMT
jgi:DNA polymerase elongation subunit (family B)